MRKIQLPLRSRGRPRPWSALVLVTPRQGRMHSRAIPAPAVQETQRQVEECHRLRELTRELIEVSDRICDAQLHAHRPSVSKKKGTYIPNLTRGLTVHHNAFIACKVAATARFPGHRHGVEGPVRPNRVRICHCLVRYISPKKRGSCPPRHRGDRLRGRTPDRRCPARQHRLRSHRDRRQTHGVAAHGASDGARAQRGPLRRPGAQPALRVRTHGPLRRSAGEDLPHGAGADHLGARLVSLRALPLRVQPA